MPMIEIKREPSKRDLRTFAVLWLAFFVVLGLIGRRGGDGLLAPAALAGVCWLASFAFNREWSRRMQLVGLLIPGVLAALWALPRLGLSGQTAEWAVLGALSGVGLIGALLSLLSLDAARLLYVWWMRASMPIGWTLSHVFLSLAFFGVVTPIGVLMRALGRDPMHRRFDRQATTYWTGHEQASDAKRYFRQF